MKQRVNVRKKKKETPNDIEYDYLFSYLECINFNFKFSFVPNRCEICKLKFPSRNATSRHFKDTHGKCVESKCKQSFCSQTRLDSHILKCHSKVKCMHCNGLFNKNHYSTHLKTVHPNDTAICHLCGKLFINEHTLKYHCEMVHTRSNKLQCDLCKLWYGISANIFFLFLHHKLLILVININIV